MPRRGFWLTDALIAPLGGLGALIQNLIIILNLKIESDE